MSPVSCNAIGDIIAMVDLGFTIVKCLADSGSARAEVSRLDNELEALRVLLTQCETALDELQNTNHRDVVSNELLQTRSEIAGALGQLSKFKWLGRDRDLQKRARSCIDRFRTGFTSIDWVLRGAVTIDVCIRRISRSIETLHLAFLTATTMHTHEQLKAIVEILTSNESHAIAMRDEVSVTQRVATSINIRVQETAKDIATLRDYQRTSRMESENLRRDIQSSLGDFFASLVERDQRLGAISLTRLPQHDGMRATAILAVQQYAALFALDELAACGVMCSFVLLASTARSVHAQAAYAFCACLLLVVPRVQRIIRGPVTHEIFITDFFGGVFALPYECARSSAALHGAVQRKFSHTLGHALTQGGMYEFALPAGRGDEPSPHALPRDWEDILQPGQKLLMNARVTSIDPRAMGCPRCGVQSKMKGQPELSDARRWVKCTDCPAYYDHCLQRALVENPSGPESAPSAHSRSPDHANSEQSPDVRETLMRCQRIRIIDLVCYKVELDASVSSVQKKYEKVLANVRIKYIAKMEWIQRFTRFLEEVRTTVDKHTETYSVESKQTPSIEEDQEAELSEVFETQG